MSASNIAHPSEEEPRGGVRSYLLREGRVRWTPRHRFWHSSIRLIAGIMAIVGVSSFQLAEVVQADVLIKADGKPLAATRRNRMMASSDLYVFWYDIVDNKPSPKSANYFIYLFPHGDAAEGRLRPDEYALGSIEVNKATTTSLEAMCTHGKTVSPGQKYTLTLFAKGTDGKPETTNVGGEYTLTVVGQTGWAIYAGVPAGYSLRKRRDGSQQMLPTAGVGLTLRYYLKRESPLVTYVTLGAPGFYTFGEGEDDRAFGMGLFGVGLRAAGLLDPIELSPGFTMEKHPTWYLIMSTALVEGGKSL